MNRKRYLLLVPVFAFLIVAVMTTQFPAFAWTATLVKDDPLVRMPGTQPGDLSLDDSGQCANCHENYDSSVEPTHNWRGSMMAQSARDFLFLATMTVAAQDAIWAVGNPNAIDICNRCHFPVGWVNERSDPTNASLMEKGDIDGVQCTVCHYMFDPFFEDTYAGTRESNDWSSYWDESSTASSTAATTARTADRAYSVSLLSDNSPRFSMFNGDPFFVNYTPPITYTENGSGQFFIGDSDHRRGQLADTDTNHNWQYSRYHKSKYFCSSCHDISNPVLANLEADPLDHLPTETEPAYSYYHVERTFSEFMLSDYGQQGGADGVGPFDPSVFNTSKPNNVIATCQDCHMRDVTGDAANNTAITRPTESTEHPNSGLSLHDLTGGSVWVPTILASAAQTPTGQNGILLNNRYSELTLDLSTNQTIGFDNPAALVDGANRSLQMLGMSAVISDVRYSPVSGNLSFEVRNQTGHKLISGYPEGRRMFVNIKYYDGDSNLLFEVNPYDTSAGTLKGLGYTYTTTLVAPATLTANERYIDELVYEMHGSSSITGEDETFHFVLSDGRYKDNRIPPKGFRIGDDDGEDDNDAFARLSEPVWEGVSAPDYFTAAEYAGGYDLVSMQNDFVPSINVPGAALVEVTLNYQTTSREYIEFLYNEINGTGELTLLPVDEPGAGGDLPYLIQTDPFFNGLRAWGDTIWDLWYHNRNSPGGAPIAIASGQWDPSSPTIVTLNNFEGVSESDFRWDVLLMISITVSFVTLVIFTWKRKKAQ